MSASQLRWRILRAAFRGITLSTGGCYDFGSLPGLFGAFRDQRGVPVREPGAWFGASRLAPQFLQALALRNQALGGLAGPNRASCCVEICAAARLEA